MSVTNENIAHSSPTSDRSRWIALMILCTGMLMIVLDSFVVNVALPKVQSDLGFSQSSLAWVVNAYLISFGGLLLFAGRLGDLLGRRDVFLTGLFIFTVASLACGVADSQNVLIAARFVQGVGGALTSAVILGMIFAMFPEPGEQAKALGVYSFVAAGGGSIGLLLGGAITQAVNWHFVFLINLPIGVATGIFALRYLKRDRGIGLSQGIDLPGAGLAIVAVMMGVYAIVKAADYGWGSTHTLGFGAGSVALLTLFIIREHFAAQPLMPLGIFRSRNVTGANLIQAMMATGMFGLFFIGALYIQQVLGFNALETGLAFVPVTGVIGILSVGASAKLNLRYGARATLIPGMAAIAIGLGYLTQVDSNGNYWTEVLPALLVMGAGAGLAFPSLVGLAMSGADPEQAGLASGLVNTTLQLGAAIGIAVLASLSTTRTEKLLNSGDSMHAALTSGYRLAFVVGAVAAAVGAVLAVVWLRPSKVGEEAGDAEPAFVPPAH